MSLSNLTHASRVIANAVKQSHRAAVMLSLSKHEFIEASSLRVIAMHEAISPHYTLKKKSGSRATT
jgi:hypothetical protein